MLSDLEFILICIGHLSRMNVQLRSPAGEYSSLHSNRACMYVGSLLML